MSEFAPHLRRGLLVATASSKGLHAEDQRHQAMSEFPSRAIANRTVNRVLRLEHGPA